MSVVLSPGLMIEDVMLGSSTYEGPIMLNVLDDTDRVKKSIHLRLQVFQAVG